ncbi:MAG: hypothetical protein GC129_04665 [Proteobacteria bacterium]|nr:hypothetical protein [Pseudomonadota bacterium]
MFPTWIFRARAVLKALIYQLSLMRTAVLLLAFCALVSMAGTVLPQGLPLQDYVAKWGVFWAQAFVFTGLTDVYRAWWFLLVLGVMLASVVACLWRNGPVIWRQFWGGKTRRFAAIGDSFAASERQLAAAGFVKAAKDGKAELWVRGRWTRLGYFLVHIGVLGVAVSGLVTGFVGWRGTMNLREGETDHIALVWKAGKATPHFLPFAVTNDGFVIDYYDSGMPKRFASRLRFGKEGTRNEERGGEGVAVREVEVNKPVRFGAYRFYQASFGDGGSIIQGEGVDVKTGETTPVVARVYEHSVLNDGTRIELLDFRPFTVETFPGERPTDVGPSVDYLVQPPDKPAMQLRAYLSHPEVVGVADGVKKGGMDEGAVVYRPVWLGIDDAELWPLVARVAAGEDYKKVMAPVLREISDERERVAEGVAVMNAAKVVKQLGLTHLLMLQTFTLRRYSGLQVVYDPAADAFWFFGGMLLAGVVLMVSGGRYARVWVKKERGTR